ncbi:MAG: hydroxyethylthiazole kinase [Blautia sp.]|nr:hydroxyethylthiazole kinase [Blautia sp.]MDY5031769.1 hydroxyethylthiazole kinase [Blautia sp.]
MAGISSDYVYEIWNKIKKTRPLVHCITNIVTVNDCANILLAAGASPTMAHHPLEAAEVTEGCRALVCNAGATESADAMERAGKRAHELGHPIVLDPVGAAGSTLRRTLCRNLMASIHPDCIRGNYTEIRALALNRKTGSGVDALEEGGSAEHTLEEIKEMVCALARQQGCLVAASGAIDVLSDGKQIITVDRGSEMMTKVTGTGCMSSALLGAFLAVDHSLESAAAMCTVMGICGERAEQKTREAGGGTGTFHIQLLDAVSLF